MKRTKKNGFTLIELLVVVAIIGIISSIGVVAYNGYTKGAKQAVIKMNHNTISKQFKLVSVRCDIDGYLNMMPNFNSTQVQSVDCPIHEATLINHIENESKLRSPYMTSERAQQNGACDQSHIDKQIGYNYVGRSNKNVIICSCIDAPCSIKANRIETSVIFYE
jgi:prepilin-type N-terminal cleavage/methylation domain-containing protein